MATSGTNYTVNWELVNGVLTISPSSGNSGIARTDNFFHEGSVLDAYIDLTQAERESVESIIFSGNISLYYKPIMESSYIKATSVDRLFLTPEDISEMFSPAYPNLKHVDVTGLNTSGVTSFTDMFFLGYGNDGLLTISGLDSLDVSSGTDFISMFEGAQIATLDVSGFPLNNAESIQSMFSGLNYCAEIIFPSNFNRDNSYEWSDGSVTYALGLASSSVPATNGGITIYSDEDFYKLESGKGGTWTRDISGTASLKFSVTSTSRDGNVATFNYTYATTTASVSVYYKKSSESSYPSTAQDTFSISGTGSNTYSVTLSTDDSYDFKFVVTDENETVYTFPSVDSNILLVSVDDDGNVTVSGDGEIGGNIEASGDVTADKYNGKVDSIDQATTPSSNKSQNVLAVRDKNNKQIGVAYSIQRSTGEIGFGFGAFRTINGTDYVNYAISEIKDDGTQLWRFTNAASFVDGLGLGNAIRPSTKTTSGWGFSANQFRSGLTVSVTSVSGYTPYVYQAYCSSHSAIDVIDAYISGTTLTFRARNRTADVITNAEFTFRILYIKNLMIGANVSQ